MRVLWCISDTSTLHVGWLNIIILKAPFIILTKIIYDGYCNILRKILFKGSLWYSYKYMNTIWSSAVCFRLQLLENCLNTCIYCILPRGGLLSICVEENLLVYIIENTLSKQWQMWQWDRHCIPNKISFYKNNRSYNIITSYLCYNQ